MRAGSHPAAALITHLRETGAPVFLSCTNTPVELQAQLEVGCHASASHEAVFFRNELFEQVSAGHNIVLP